MARNLTTFRANAAPLLTAPLHQAGLEVSEVGEVSLGRAIAVSAAVAGRPADGDFTPRTVACGLAGFTCTGSTLQQALAQGAVFPATSLSDLGGALSALDVDDVAAAFPEDLDVNDVVLGFLEAEDYPWEQLDLVGSGVQEFDPSPEVVTYTIAADPAGEGPFHGSISATLPVGARFVPGSTQLSPESAGDAPVPTVQETSTGTVLTWRLAGIDDAGVTLRFDANPGLQLGTFAVRARASLGGLTTSASPLATQVVEPDGEPSPDVPRSVAGDTLYLGYVDEASDVDMYSFAPPAGRRVGVRLSHFAGDADLVLYGPPSDVGGAGDPNQAPARSVGSAPAAADDVAGDLIGTDGSLPDQATSADVPVDPDATVLATSTSHRAPVEAAEATGADRIQVSAYNGMDNTLPYVLRVRTNVPRTPVQCTTYAESVAEGSEGTLDPSAVPASARTLLLIDRGRFAARFGEEATQTTMTKLEELASEASVDGAVVPVDGDAAVRAAMSEWDADSCSPDKANDVVGAVAGLVGRITAGDGDFVPHPS